MKLYINTTDTNKIVVGLDKDVFEEDARKEKSQRLLQFIDELLVKKKKTFKDIDSIKVETGPGSFTGVRVGVVVAQTLGWLFNIPVNGKDLDKEKFIKINYE